jgi:hypothetical protein
MKVLKVREPESDIRINNSSGRRTDDFKTIFSTSFVISSFSFLSAMGVKNENFYQNQVSVDATVITHLHNRSFANTCGYCSQLLWKFVYVWVYQKQGVFMCVCIVVIPLYKNDGSSDFVKPFNKICGSLNPYHIIIFSATFAPNIAI